MDRLHIHKHTRCLSTNIMGLLPRSCLLLLVVVSLVPDAIAQDNATTEAPGTGATSEPGDCNTDICVKSCAGCDVGVSVPDPTECHNYFLCDGNGGYLVPDSLPCGTGEVFNATQHECVNGEECNNCESPPPSECVYECAALATEPSADSPGKIAILTDCLHYVECVPDEGNVTRFVETPMICPAETPFFGEGECQEDETKCCHCRPYCSLDAAPGDSVANPRDCREYFICIEGGTEPINSVPCSNGYFDSITNECSELVPCITQTQCINVVGSDGCIEPLTCLEEGFFARCPNQCTPYYYHCEEATGEYQDAESCNDGTVFHPDEHTCVATDECP